MRNHELIYLVRSNHNKLGNYKLIKHIFFLHIPIILQGLEVDNEDKLERLRC